jgi:hypothetical protein
VLIVMVVCSASLAGVLAVRAFAAGDDNYCNGCTLAKSGIPAVSQAHHYTFIYNDLSTYPYEPFTFYDEEVYYYSASLNQSFCVRSTYGTEVTSTNCGSQGNLVDARCHVIHQSGPAQADCIATYNTN